MTTIKAMIKGGRLELDVPSDWPDGMEVEIHPLDQTVNGGTQAMSHEEISRTLAAMDLVEPFDMTDAGLAAWESDRQARKDREKAEFAEHGEKLRKGWE